MDETINDVGLSDYQKQLIERVGVLQEKAGLQPAAARILALLLVSDRTELSFDEIREALNISKSAASNALNLLLSLHKIDYITLPGDRKRYFKSRIGEWQNEMKAHMEGFVAMNSLFREILAQRSKGTPDFNKSLSELVQFMEFLEKEIPLLCKRWEENRG